MAKSLVGRITGTTTNGGNVVLDLTALTGGLDDHPSSGDLIIVGGGAGNDGSGTGFPSPEYAEIDSGVAGSSCEGVLAYKIADGSETSVTYTGGGSSLASVAAFAEVWRGANISATVAKTTADGDSTNPDPPAITPDAANTMIGVFAFTRLSDASVTAPSTFGNLTTINASGDSADVTLMHATLDGQASGSPIDPAAFTNVSGTDWRAVTYCIVDAVAAGADFALSKTLGALTSSAAATVDITASVSKTLGALTGSAAFTAGTPGDCALAKTLGSLTASAAATVDIAALLSKTLASLTVSSAATVAIDAALSKTLGPLTVSATAETLQSADFSLSRTLGNLSATAAATVNIDALLSKTLAAITSSANANVDIAASLSGTLGALTGSGSISGEASVSVGVTLDALTSSGFIFKWDRETDENDPSWSPQSGASPTWTAQGGAASSWSSQSGSSQTWTRQSGSAPTWTEQ